MKNRILKRLFHFLVLIAALEVTVAVSIPFIYAGYMNERANFSFTLETLIGVALLTVYVVTLTGTLAYGVFGPLAKLHRELFGEPRKS